MTDFKDEIMTRPCGCSSLDGTKHRENQKIETNGAPAAAHKQESLPSTCKAAKISIFFGAEKQCSKCAKHVAIQSFRPSRRY